MLYSSRVQNAAWCVLLGTLVLAKLTRLLDYDSFIQSLTSNSNDVYQNFIAMQQVDSIYKSPGGLVVLAAKLETFHPLPLPDDNCGDRTIQKAAAAHHLCLNADFLPCQQTSVWTMVTDGVASIQGATVLGASIRNVTHGTIDMVAMELVNKPLHPLVWKQLHAVGWKRCQVQRVEPVHISSVDRFVDQFTELRLWGMTVYDRLIYMNSDTVVVGEMDELVQFNLTGDHKIGATEDFFRRGFNGQFNMGVFVIHPSQVEYDRLIDLQENGQIVYDYAQSEQGWLNEVFKGQWQDIGFQNNANLVVYGRKRGHWNNYADKIAVIHFTIEKPWSCSYSDIYQDVCERWQRVFRELVEHDDSRDPCQNADYTPEHKTAVITMNTGMRSKREGRVEAYINATIALGLSIRQHTTIPVDLLVFELLTSPLPTELWPSLERVGWKRCVVNRIEPPHKTPKQFRDQFTKLRMWALSAYDSVLYMDSDALVIGPIHELLTMNLEGRQIGVTHDFRGGRFRNSFNMGVCKVAPNSVEYSRLLQLSGNKSAVIYEAAMSEQGWLNAVYRDQWTDIGFKNNANMVALTNTNVSREDVRVVHFTAPKPWECTNKTGVERYCKLWHETLTNGLAGIKEPAII